VHAHTHTQVNYAGNPSLLYSGFRTFNTSHANAQHYVHYLADVAAVRESVVH